VIIRAREESLSLLGPDLSYNELVNRVSSSPKLENQSEDEGSFRVEV